MSSDKTRDVENVHQLIDHLSLIQFSGTVMVSFHGGAPTNISRKDEWTPDLLDRYLHKPVVIKRKKFETAESGGEPVALKDAAGPAAPVSEAPHEN